MTLLTLNARRPVRRGRNIDMGFYEDDRIRRKNRQYNFPTPEINCAARTCIKDLVDSGFTGTSLVEELKHRLSVNDSKHVRDTLTTAITITEKERL